MIARSSRSSFKSSSSSDDDSIRQINMVLSIMVETACKGSDIHGMI